MREFNYSKLLSLNIAANMYDLISKIYEYKGKQELYVANFPDILENGRNFKNSINKIIKCN